MLKNKAEHIKDTSSGGFGTTLIRDFSWPTTSPIQKTVWKSVQGK